jgi:peptidoglycan hydrolase-like protein with peptidoglycan-binding domain
MVVRWAWLVTLLLAVLASSPVHALKADAQLRRAQETLLERGYDPGPADGLMGRRTRSALQAFQRTEKLRQTGKLDRATRAALFPVGPAAGATSQPSAVPASRAPVASESGNAQPAPKPTPAAKPAVATTPASNRSQEASGALSYRRLGWVVPASGAQISIRHGRGGNSPIRVRETGSLVVPDASQIYILARGERIPEFGCEPRKGKLHMDMAMGLDGPVTFTSLDEKGYCQLGFGIVLEEGQVLEFEEAWWGDRKIRGGKVRVGRSALEYVRGG